MLDRCWTVDLREILGFYATTRPAVLDGYFSSGLQLSGLILDTGSSSTTLDVDLGTWKQLTGRSEAISAMPPVEEHDWGKVIHRITAPATGDLKIGTITFSHPMVSTIVERPQYYSTAMAGDGLIGNVPFLRRVQRSRNRMSQRTVKDPCTCNMVVRRFFVAEEWSRRTISKVIGDFTDFLS